MYFIKKEEKVMKFMRVLVLMGVLFLFVPVVSAGKPLDISSDPDYVLLAEEDIASIKVSYYVNVKKVECIDDDYDFCLVEKHGSSSYLLYNLIFTRRSENLAIIHDAYLYDASLGMREFKEKTGRTYYSPNSVIGRAIAILDEYYE